MVIFVLEYSGQAANIGGLVSIVQLSHCLMLVTILFSFCRFVWMKHRWWKTPMPRCVYFLFSWYHLFEEPVVCFV